MNEIEKPPQEPDFKEAFCLMTYQCEQCHKMEEVYNTRNGITPFTIRCRYCGGTARHINWQYDKRDPDFKPLTGMRVFIDLTPEKAKEYAVKRLKSCIGTEYEIPIGTPEYDKMIHDLTEHFVNECCAVDLVEVKCGT